MSVKQHEPICLDSAQDRFWWMDHFLGDQIQDEWLLTVGGTGTGAVIDQQTGGIIRLSVPANNDTSLLDWGNRRTLHVDQRVAIEFRAKSGGDTGQQLELALEFTRTTTWIAIYKNTGNDVVNIICENGGVATAFATANTWGNAYHVYRIECHLHGSSHVHFYVDGVETTNSPITTNIPDDAADFLQPMIYLNAAVAGGGATVDIDYVAVRQDR